jgi:hypothetical protein
VHCVRRCRVEQSYSGPSQPCFPEWLFAAVLALPRRCRPWYSPRCSGKARARNSINHFRKSVPASLRRQAAGEQSSGATPALTQELRPDIITAWRPPVTIGPFDPIGHSGRTSLPQRLQRIRGPKDGTVASSAPMAIPRRLKQELGGECYNHASKEWGAPPCVRIRNGSDPCRDPTFHTHKRLFGCCRASAAGRVRGNQSGSGRREDKRLLELAREARQSR